MYTITITSPTLDILGKLAKAAGLSETTAEVTQIKTEKAPKVKETRENAEPALKPALSPKEIQNKIMELTVALSHISRETAVAVLAQFNVKKASELKPEQYEGYLRAGTAVLENQNKKEDDLV